MQSVPVERDAIGVSRSAPQEREQPLRVLLPSGGIHTDKAPNELAPNEAVSLSGLHFVAGRLVRDTGYVPYGHGYLGTPQLLQQFKFIDSTTVELLITSQFVYKYVSAVSQWQLVSLDPERHVDGAAPAGTTDILLDDSSNILVGTVIGILLDDGTQWIVSVTALPAPNTVTIDLAIPPGRTAPDTSPVAIEVPLTGDPALFQVCYAFYSGNSWVVFSNNINVIYYYDHLLGTVKELGGLPTNTTCAAMSIFHGMLLLGNLTEDGDHLPYRVRQSDIGNPEGWTPGVNGVAAIYDLLDTPDYVLALKTLGPWIICYRDSSIMRGSFIGALNEIIFWEYMSQQDGILSQGAVADVGSAHVIVGTNNVYAYQGDYTLPPIGEGVFQNFLAKAGDIYSPAQQTVFCTYVPTLREVWIFYPSSDVAVTPVYPNKMLRFNVSLKSWQERVFADATTCVGPFTPQTSVTWATAPSTWNDVIYARAWDSRINSQNVPNLFLGPAAGAQVFMYDFAALTDNGVTIQFEFITREYGDGAAFTRWERLAVTGTGASTVELSIDQGATWTALGDLALGATEAARELWPDLVSTRLMLRLSGDDEEFSFRYATIFTEFESEW